ncbi:hypothetical protein R3P38DRAFT_3366046 [Favolaschia claudopus]|uniref:Uncharacterized protein n=1 Tax=Favolaschia claudopus TaxID=2862362 RepID=A0AAW0AFH7_9AGAR
MILSQIFKWLQKFDAANDPKARVAISASLRANITFLIIPGKDETLKQAGIMIEPRCMQRIDSNMLKQIVQRTSQQEVCVNFTKALAEAPKASTEATTEAPKASTEATTEAPKASTEAPTEAPKAHAAMCSSMITEDLANTDGNVVSEGGGNETEDTYSRNCADRQFNMYGLKKSDYECSETQKALDASRRERLIMILWTYLRRSIQLYKRNP